MQVEEKNKKIELYIEDKIKELESNSMYVPNENKEKLLMAFMNRNEDIEIIKTKIDTIFNKSVAAYKENMEKELGRMKKELTTYDRGKCRKLFFL